MDNVIVITNPPSPGTSFTEHTDATILKCYDFLESCTLTTISYQDFQKKLSTTKNLKESNLRCIWPMLRYAGLVSYDKEVNVKTFFTKSGTQYVEVLKLLDYLREPDISLQNADGYNEALKLRTILIRCALVSIAKSSGCSYSKAILQTFRFLRRYNSIDVVEFAYLAYGMQQGAGDPVDIVSSLVADHRSGNNIGIKLTVRDDAKGTIQQKESLSWMTSYGYILALLEQAGVVSKKDGKFYINSGAADDFENALVE